MPFGARLSWHLSPVTSQKVNEIAGENFDLLSKTYYLDNAETFDTAVLALKL